MTNTRQIKKDLETIKRALTPDPETNQRRQEIHEALRRYDWLHKEATKGMTPQQIYHFNREAVKGALQILREKGFWKNREPPSKRRP